MRVGVSLCTSITDVHWEKKNEKERGKHTHTFNNPRRKKPNKCVVKNGIGENRKRKKEEKLTSKCERTKRLKRYIGGSTCAFYVSVSIIKRVQEPEICHGFCILCVLNANLCTLFMVEVVRHEVKFVVCLLFYGIMYRGISQDKQ